MVNVFIAAFIYFFLGICLAIEYSRQNVFGMMVMLIFLVMAVAYDFQVLRMRREK